MNGFKNSSDLGIVNSVFLPIGMAGFAMDEILNERFCEKISHVPLLAKMTGSAEEKMTVRVGVDAAGRPADFQASTRDRSRLLVNPPK